MNTTILKPVEFRSHIESITDRVSVHRTCNELLEQLEEKHSVATISKMLASYRSELKKIENPKFSEVVNVKHGNVNQHIAINLLSLNDKQINELAEHRTKSTNKVLGFDVDGNLRNVELPSIDISAIVEKATNLLRSNNYRELSCALLLLTGLRPTEQTLSERYYDNFDQIIERDMVALEGNRIAFKGLNKKRTLEDVTSYFVRPCLVPSELLIKHQKRYTTLSPWNANSKDESINRAIQRQFNQTFADDLATIADYDENGKACKPNAYKMRAFYACALRASLIAKGMGENQAAAYIQKSLGHESPAETVRYLSKYESTRFINPIELDLDLNINEVGKMLVEIPEVTNEPELVIEPQTKSQETIFDVDKFIEKLDETQRLKFAKTLEESRDLTTAVLSLIALSTEKNEIETPKETVTDRIETIFQAIVEHNKKQETPEDCLFPSWGLIDKISKLTYDKSIAKITYDKWERDHKNSIDNHLKTINIPASDRNSLWNGKHHKRTIKTKIDDVVKIIQSNGSSN